MNETLAVAVPLAVIVTTLVSMVKQAFDPEGTRVPSVVWLVLAFGLGLVVALVYNVNAFDHLGNTSDLQGSVGKVLTGLAIGGFASGWHEATAAVRSFRTKNENATVTTEVVAQPSTRPRTK